MDEILQEQEEEPSSDMMPEEMALLVPDGLDELDGSIPPEGDITAPEEVNEDEMIEKVKTLLKSMIEEFDRNEQPVRDRMVRHWKKCELFWKGVQNIYWDYVARDFRTLSSDYRDSNIGSEELDFYYQDKIVNIFRAHGESVISALTQDIPAVIFPPDDADNQDDVATAKAYTKAAELLQKCNNADILMINLIFMLWNTGVVACYNYNSADFEFGSYTEDLNEDVEKTQQNLACPHCGKDMGLTDNPEDASMPQYCESCDVEVEPMMMDEQKFTESVKVGEVEKPKQREKLEFYSPLSFKLPHYVSNPKFTPYMMLDTEAHIDYMRSLYPDEEFSEEYDPERYDRWARTSTDYRGEETHGLVTYRRVWLRSWTFNKFKRNEVEAFDFLMQKYPDGIKVCMVNDKIVSLEAENLDAHWTFTLSPLSTHIHAEPLGSPLLPIQEMRNELVVLKLQTIEYGIPETFADPAALDFNAYRLHENEPGKIFPAKKQAGESLESAFASLKTATYPKEATDFQQELDSDGQFVTGAFPSIYGGSMPSASKTAAEYTMSRNQALQRLQTTWKIISKFWAAIMDKSVRSFIEHMTRDESFTQRKGGGFINVYIRQNEVTGKVGSCEPEVAQTFPMSWMQKRDMLVQMLQLNNEFVNQAMFHPENTDLTSRYLGFTDFYIPGDDSRTKQLAEIQKLLGEEPFEDIENPDIMTGEAPILPSVEIDPELDDHEIEYNTGVAWLNSEIGQDAKQNNPAGYINVRAHILQHLQFVQMMEQAQMEAEQEANSETSSNNKSKGESNVSSGEN